MKADEIISGEKGITISIPINITIPTGGGAPEIGTIAAPAGDEFPDQAIMVPPLQQQIELMKQQGGKESKVINQLINQDPESPEPFFNNENRNEISDNKFDTESEADQVLELIKRRKERLNQY